MYGYLYEELREYFNDRADAEPGDDYEWLLKKEKK
jgi:hypothetical protein